MEKEQHRHTAEFFDENGYNVCYYHSDRDNINFDEWYNQTYGGNK